MPDITMCTNAKCPVSDYCYRSTSKPDKYQSWHSFKGHVQFNKDGIISWKCNYYIPLNKQDNTNE